MNQASQQVLLVAAALACWRGACIRTAGGRPGWIGRKSGQHLCRCGWMLTVNSEGPSLPPGHGRTSDAAVRGKVGPSSRVSGCKNRPPEPSGFMTPIETVRRLVWVTSHAATMGRRYMFVSEGDALGGSTGRRHHVKSAAFRRGRIRSTGGCRRAHRTARHRSPACRSGAWWDSNAGPLRNRFAKIARPAAGRRSRAGRPARSRGENEHAGEVADDLGAARSRYRTDRPAGRLGRDP